MAKRKRAQARKLEEEAAKWERGAEGEKRVGKVLDRLPLDHLVFHDLQIPGSKANIDHLVVGPGGVFAIDSKKYKYAVNYGSGRGSDRLWTGRNPVRLDPCKWEASEAESRLGVPVTPMLCIIAPSLPRGSFTFDGVQICQPSHVQREITRSAQTALDVQAIGERVQQVFGTDPEVRTLAPPVPTQATISVGAAPARRTALQKLAHGIQTVERLWQKPAVRLLGVSAVALVGLMLLPLIVPLSQWGGQKLSDRLFSDLVPTTSTSAPPTTEEPPPTSVEPVSEADGLTAPVESIADPPPVPITTTCRGAGLGWAASFGWPGDLPSGAEAYSIRWQLDDGPVIRHDIGGWTDPADPPVGLSVASDAQLLVITDHLGSDGQILASTEQLLDLSGDC